MRVRKDLVHDNSNDLDSNNSNSKKRFKGPHLKKYYIFEKNKKFVCWFC